MTSILAKEDIQKIWDEGGTITVDDIIRLNAIALKITDDPNSALAVMPRFVSVGGVHFREPTVGQSIFIDEAKRIFPDDGGTELALLAYVLAHQDIEMSSLQHPFILKSKIILWFKTKLHNMTIEQLEQIVYYCLYGCTDKSLEFPAYKVDDKADGNDGLGTDKSWALQDYLGAVSLGIDSVAALRATSPQLSQMVERAYVISKGPLKGRDKILTADYYRTLDEIRQKAFEHKDGSTK